MRGRVGILNVVGQERLPSRFPEWCRMALEKRAEPRGFRALCLVKFPRDARMKSQVCTPYHKVSPLSLCDVMSNTALTFAYGRQLQADGINDKHRCPVDDGVVGSRSSLGSVDAKSRLSVDFQGPLIAKLFLERGFIPLYDRYNVTISPWSDS